MLAFTFPGRYLYDKAELVGGREQADDQPGEEMGEKYMTILCFGQSILHICVHVFKYIYFCVCADCLFSSSVLTQFARLW